MAPAERNPTRGDGVDGRVLETGVEHFGTRRIRIAVGERARSQGGTWTQNGSKGQPVDRRFAQAWIAAKQFCAAASNPGFAGFDTDPGDPDARAHFDLQPDSEGPGRRQHQTGIGSQRRIWRLGARDPAGTDERRE